MPAYPLELRAPAREFFERVPPSVRNRLLAIFAEIQEDPLVDNLRKFEYLGFLPAVCTAWTDDEFRVVYQVVDYPSTGETIIEVWAITRAETF
jgi:hypothetical protein